MSQLGSHGESFFSVGFCPRLGTPRGLTQSCTVQHCAGNPSDETKIKLGSIRVLFRPRREPEARAWDTPSQLHAAASSPEIQAHDCRRKHVNRGLCLTPKRAESCQWISMAGSLILLCVGQLQFGLQEAQSLGEQSTVGDLPIRRQAVYNFWARFPPKKTQK